MAYKLDPADREALQLLLSKKPATLVPFIGAGLSKAAGFPSWKELVEDLLRYGSDLIQLSKAETFIKTALAAGHYPEALERIQVVLKRQFQNRIYSLLSKEPDSVVPVEPLTLLSPRYVITTNLDVTLQRVWPQAAIFSPDGPNFRATIDRSTKLPIIKWHGDIDREDTWVLTQSQYDQFYGRDWANQFLKTFASEHSLLFIGYGLQEDDINHILKAVARGSGFTHYALFQEPGDAKKTDSEKYKEQIELRNKNVRVIWYDDHNDVQDFIRFLSTLVGAAREGVPRTTKQQERLSSDLVEEDTQSSFRTFVNRFRGLPLALRIVVSGLILAAMPLIAASSSDWFRNWVSEQTHANWQAEHEWRVRADDEWMISPERQMQHDNRGVRIAPQSWAAPKRFEEPAFEIFQLRFELFLQPRSQPDTDTEINAEWVLRPKLSPPPARLSDIPGLHFQLIRKETEEGALYIRGFRVQGTGMSEPLDRRNNSDHLIYTGRFHPDQYLLVFATVIRNRIRHCIMIQSSDPKDSTPGLGVPWPDSQGEFVDTSRDFDSSAVAFGSTAENPIVIGDVAVGLPPSAVLSRCFFGGRFCLKPEVPRPCS